MAVDKIYLIAHNYKREIYRIARIGLYKKLVAPHLERFEGGDWRNIENKHTAVDTSVEAATETQEAFLTRSVPDLQLSQNTFLYKNGDSIYGYLECDNVIVHPHLFRRKVESDCALFSFAESSVYVPSHKWSFSYTLIPYNYYFQKRFFSTIHFYLLPSLNSLSN